MATEGLRQRRADSAAQPDTETKVKPRGSPSSPLDAPKKLTAKEALRVLALAVYFLGSCCFIMITQFVGAPLYFYNKDWYYAWMAMTKQHFGYLIITLKQWWSPTMIRISGDASVKGQLRQTEDGRLECDFPERLVLIANHQIDSDWLYLWWISYTAKMHGHIYIILKESLKWIPVLGQGMMFYGFIFLSRKWAKDKSRFSHRLQKLNSRHKGPLSGSQSLDPMWLLIFPEGTNLSDNSRESSARFAAKTGVPDLQHQLLPRSTGLQFCLQELKDTVDWIYDCTIGYEGIQRGEYGQDIYTLRTVYFQGNAPKSVNLHWRRFAVSKIPIDDPREFELWLKERWLEKDALMEYYMTHGRFPGDESAVVPSKFKSGSAVETKDAASGKTSNVYVETRVKPQNPFEFLQIYAVNVALMLVVNVVMKIWYIVKSLVGAG